MHKIKSVPLGWIQCLPEVGGRINSRQERIQGMLNKACALEAEALRLRQLASQDKTALDLRVRHLWTRKEIASAKARWRRIMRGQPFPRYGG